MSLLVLPQAATELKEAVEYYEGEQPGLGERLWNEIDRYLHWIAENPTLPRLRSGGYRRVNISVFPYYVAYAIRGEAIVILAISHSARLPEHWIGRV
ncbi:MAG: type II toxin-antitoxin system RelE/ParE family toxin [Chthoniobacteraceae bacterium]